MSRNASWQPTARLGRTLLVILLGGGAVLWLSTLAGWPATPDGAFHFQRVRALSEALAQGVLFPRNFPDFAFGYGYPVLNFYAPAFYYPPALLHLAGLDVSTATQLILVATVLISAAALIGLLRALGLRPAAARFGALVFVLFPYRLYDYFVRGALPELAAFLWLPCIAWSMLAAARANTPERRAATILVGGLCWSGLILTHNLTALMVAGASIVAIGAVLLARRLLGKRGDTAGALQRIALGFFLGLLLSAWYTVPALLESGNVAIGRESSNGYTNHLAQWGSLFDWGLPYTYPAAADPVVPLPAWLVIPAFGVILLLILRRKNAKGAATQVATVAATLGLLLLSIWLTTESSAFLWRLFAPLMSRLQFPWRWQSILTLATAVALALNMQAILTGRPRQIVRIVSLFAAAFVATYTLAGLPSAVRMEKVGDVTRAAMWAFDAEQGQVGATWTAEFLPRWVTEERWAIGREPSTAEVSSPATPVSASATLVDDGYLHATYSLTERRRCRAKLQPLLLSRLGSKRGRRTRCLTACRRARAAGSRGSFRPAHGRAALGGHARRLAGAPADAAWLALRLASDAAHWQVAHLGDGWLDCAWVAAACREQRRDGAQPAGAAGRRRFWPRAVGGHLRRTGACGQCGADCLPLACTGTERRSDHLHPPARDRWNDSGTSRRAPGRRLHTRLPPRTRGDCPRRADASPPRRPRAGNLHAAHQASILPGCLRSR